MVLMAGRSLTSLVNPTPTQFSLLFILNPKFLTCHTPFPPLTPLPSPKTMASKSSSETSSKLTKNNPRGYSKILRNSFNDGVCKYQQVKTLQTTPTFVEEVREIETVDLWLKMKEEAELDVTEEPILNSYYQSSILSHESLESALANHLANRLSSASLPSNTLFDLFVGILKSDREIMDSVKDDLKAVKERDPACISHVHCFLNFKGFLACQSHRVAHKLWLQGRKVLAVMIQNRVSEVFAVDIHPGAKIGSGILLDHATGLVVGETAVIGNNVSILHSVTLGGTGKASGDRHPKIGDGVLIGAGTCILGNIKVGECAKIGAGSVVIKDVPPRTTVVGNPAKLVGGKNNPVKLDKMPSFTMDHTSHITEFYDYCI
ncbi:Short-chain dehydrogenase/reductase sat3 [Stylosanthes scabra]|uniref:serine O-acetyltransferase n=1 Tax=Stylosanthes scabra TaxID=79078 RepID=A0ABU6YE05_9FABA|nr:Short-chain dehydrogenase/reductase sat3 [Stylosanthes scabra]